jgi:hypothetical protein
MQRLFSRIIEQIVYEEKPQGFEVYQKENLVCKMKEDNLVENLQCTAEAW